METQFFKPIHEYQETDGNGRNKTNTALAILLLANRSLIKRTFNNEIKIIFRENVV
jgi:hypothetical protein